MPIPIPAESYSLLMDLINQTYLDRVEQIIAAQVDDNDSIVAVALDGRKKLACKITDGDINIRLMGGEKAVDSLKFAAPQKKKNCTKGISCGLSCISATRTCRKPLSPNQKAQKKSIVDKSKSSASVNSPKPESQVLSQNKEQDYTHQPITRDELKQAWGAQQKANEYEATRLQLKTEKDAFTKKMLKEKLGRLKQGAKEGLGEPLHDLKTIQDNANVIFAMTMSGDNNVAIKSGDRVVAAFSYEKEKGREPLYVDFLATSPDNMFSGTNPTKGAGREAIKAMVAESLRQGKKGAIKLLPLTRAVGFYEKMGFKMGKDGMILTPEAAKQHM